MRKNSPRKWLHACLDLLPVILIPVFMIYSHRHTIDSGSIEVPQNQVVDFNQLSTINEFEYENSSYLDITLVTEHEYKIDEIYLIQVTQAYSYTTNSRNIPLFNDNGTYINILSLATKLEGNLDFYSSDDTNLSSGNYFARVKFNSDFEGIMFYWVVGGDLDNNYYHVNVFNLTQMFGSGNEPTYAQFLQYYPLQDYAYTLSHKELLKNTSTITYSDTDIMSQFTYQLYNSVDKYFNMGNVFNMTSVYDWFNLNIFGGNAPISIYIVWNIVLYEFVMDLLFLLYGLFMWFIDMVQHLMDKPFKSIK